MWSWLRSRKRRKKQSTSFLIGRTRRPERPAGLPVRSARRGRGGGRKGQASLILFRGPRRKKRKGGSAPWCSHLLDFVAGGKGKSAAGKCQHEHKEAHPVPTMARPLFLTSRRSGTRPTKEKKGDEREDGASREECEDMSPAIRGAHENGEEKGEKKHAGAGEGGGKVGKSLYRHYPERKKK